MSNNLSALFGGNSDNGKPLDDDLDALFGLPDPAPLPAGWYPCEFVRGGLGQSKNGKARYELRARLIEGEHLGRIVFDDFYLTAAAWWKSKPILGKLGIDSPEKLRRELPSGLVGRIRLVIEERDGVRRNKVCDLELTGRTPPDASIALPVPAIDPFAPSPAESASLAAEQSERGRPTPESRDNALEQQVDRRAPTDGLSFSYGANADGPYAPGGDKP